MNNFLVGLGLALLVAGAGEAGTCNSDIPTQWVMANTYIDGITTNAVQGDGSPYVNGQSGVTARINVCSGTGDATLLLSSKRVYVASFAKMLAETSHTPSYAASGQTEPETFVNVRNVLYVPTGSTRADEYQFTTQVHCCSGLVLLNPTSQATGVASGPDGQVANSPYPNSLVDVYHCPADSTATSGLCVGIVHETWFVWPDSNPTAAGTGIDGGPITQVATLTVSKGNSTYDSGEFSIPFYFVITSLQ